MQNIRKQHRMSVCKIVQLQNMFKTENVLTKCLSILTVYIFSPNTAMLSTNDNKDNNEKNSTTGNGGSHKQR
jgi:hypothetical protein